jgi:hypothetical protein
VSIWPFKKQRDVNQLIFDCAEFRRPADQRELIALLLRTELFAPVVSGAPNLPNGSQHVVGAGDSIQLATARLGSLNCVAFFTNRSDARLAHPCASMTGEEAMRMVLKAKADGIMIQNTKTSYFGLDAQGIRDALEAA